MNRMLSRQTRVEDIRITASLTRGVRCFASNSFLVVAGQVPDPGAIERAHGSVSEPAGKAKTS